MGDRQVGNGQIGKTQDNKDATGSEKGRHDMDHVIETDIPPGDPVNPEEPQEPEFQGKKIRQHLNDECRIADVRTEIKVEKKGDVQRKEKKNDVGEKEKKKFLEAGGSKKVL